jgi:TonB family protein
VAVIRFTVGRGGEVLSVAILQSSGSPTLDAAALATLRGARLPPFTADMAQANATVTVPIRYRLEQ